MIVGQPVGKELIAKEENKIQIFISHNCILDLGLDPVEAESPSPAHPGLGPGPAPPGRSPLRHWLLTSAPDRGISWDGEGEGTVPTSLCRHWRRRCVGPQASTCAKV